MSHPATILIPQMAHTLAQFLVWIDKAEAYASSRGFDPKVLLSARLAPDMFTLYRQIASACDTAKLSVSRLSDRVAPKHTDDQETWDEVRERIEDVLTWLAAANELTFEGAGEQRIRFGWAPGRSLRGDDYLLQFAIPNFHFHASMAYAIFRHNGVPLGKADFLGGLPFVKDED